MSRGRESAASQEAQLSPEELKAEQDALRPPPPDYLDDDEKTMWKSIVDRMPAGWFPEETLPLLEQYCHALMRARSIAKKIKKAEDSIKTSVSDYGALLRMETQQSKLIATLATKMRLSQQSSYDRSKRKPVVAAKPWNAAPEQNEDE